MAKFYIENEKGDRIDLQDELNYGLYEGMKDIGYSQDASFTRVGDYYSCDSKNPKQSDIDFDINFFEVGEKSVYQKVSDVGDFLVNAERLYYVYVPEEIEYKREVEFVNFSQNTKEGYLSYSVKLSPLTLFYAENIVALDVDRTEGEKRYRFRWNASYNDYANRSVKIKEGNQADIAFDLEIYGYVVNPKISVYKGATLIKAITFPVTLQEGEYLKYSSRDLELEIKKVDVLGNETNLISEFSLEDDIFFKLDKNGCIIKFTSDVGVMNKILFTPYIYKKVV